MMHKIDMQLMYHSTICRLRQSFLALLAYVSEDAPGEGDRFKRLSAGNPLERNPLPALVECNLELLEEPFPADQHGDTGTWI